MVCGVTDESSTETEVLATVAEAPADEACTLTLRIVDTFGADSASNVEAIPELTDCGGPDWDVATEDTPAGVEACVVEAKLEGTKRDEILVLDESRGASVAKEET